jgi:flagellar basal-body rod modification protein FlgD
MSTTPPIPTPTITGTNGTKGTELTRNVGSTLGKDDFLKLLVSQMKNMDPLGEGKDPTDSMAQMTQYSMLEQMQNINASTQRSSTIGLIGHTVSYTLGDGTTAEGAVEQVTTVGGKLALTIGGKGGIDPATVVEVR